jgi:hypothetical protein
MSTLWPYPGSATVSCGMGEHKCRGINCSCDCHLQGRALPVMQRLAAPQEQHLELFIEQVFGVKPINPAE